MKSSPRPHSRLSRIPHPASPFRFQCFSISAFSLSLCALLCGNAFGQSSPKLLPFQGRLTDQNGIAVSNGVRLVQFKIYDVPTGGSPVWAGELHRTTVNGGLVNVMLGSKTPLNGVDFDKQLYLEITVDVSGPTGQPDNAITAADPPMLPRQAILPVVFAKEAADSRLLDGHDWSAILVGGATNPASGTIRGSKIQPQGITASQIAPNAIGTAEIATNAIRTANIADGQITSEKLSSDLTRDSVIPAGTIQAFGGPNTPDGWLLCDGTAHSSNSYPRLFAIIGTSWGGGYTNVSGTQVRVSGADFNLPDLRGMFLRGVNQDRSDAWRDDAPEARTNSYPVGNTANRVGSIQSDAGKQHQHLIMNGVRNPGSTDTGYLSRKPSYLNAAVDNNAGWDYHLFGDETPPDRGKTSAAGEGTETRPRNAYVHYIIKY